MGRIGIQYRLHSDIFGCNCCRSILLLGNILISYFKKIGNTFEKIQRYSLFFTISVYKNRFKRKRSISFFDAIIFLFLKSCPSLFIYITKNCKNYHKHHSTNIRNMNYICYPKLHLHIFRYYKSDNCSVLF